MDRLAAAHPDVPRDEIAHIVATAHEQFEHSRIREFVPLFVERRAHAELARRESLLVWSS
ncbi:hypothetical protein MSZK_07570 [Mycobacterium sp. shizuoka-1]|nr:hypothetical protein [Mycobacterium sp. shizuoka-1]GAY14031.1 hypothetical protein MSZK_07570 [Mycobacterium sp. shizuoka-1]